MINAIAIPIANNAHRWPNAFPYFEVLIVVISIPNSYGKLREYANEQE